MPCASFATHLAENGLDIRTIQELLGHSDAESAPQLGFDRERLAIYGGSAGGGLTIATALMTRDRGGPAPCLIMAPYPMIDDRNETPSSHEITNIGIWDRDANREAWQWYLGGKPADGYAAPARAKSLSGLPPTFIDGGEMDLFRDEDIAFATRLLQSVCPPSCMSLPVRTTRPRSSRRTPISARRFGPDASRR